MTKDQKGLVHFIPESKEVEVEEQLEKFQGTINKSLDAVRLEMIGYEAYLRDLLYGADYRLPRRKF